MIEFDILAEGGGWESLPEAEALAAKAGEAAASVAGVADKDFEISLLLADDARVQELNRDFRGKDKPTNVLSFPAPEPPEGFDGGNFGPRHLGDIALAYETLVREAEAEAKPLAHHYAHLIVHGVLHLLGYDHEVEEDAQIMEALEVKALATLGIDDPYRDMAA
ncbi:rRNA maturation RNase YbeY [Microvirga flavescens]|uniref:rRNA maturation RNase YbeY n=1 Tax=Microvirga flavescens TaxID=2249811 RepID=UPI000DD98FF6|nr:rRNA maturation RNase YbeY [Microvirga flavescens]